MHKKEIVLRFFRDNAVADLGEGHEGRVPLSVQFFLIFMQFSKQIMPNNRLAPPSEFDAPLENPGSATETVIWPRKPRVNGLDLRPHVAVEISTRTSGDWVSDKSTARHGNMDVSNGALSVGWSTRCWNRILGETRVIQMKELKIWFYLKRHHVSLFELPILNGKYVLNGSISVNPKFPKVPEGAPIYLANFFRKLKTIYMNKIKEIGSIGASKILLCRSANTFWN